jgi:hypothetical protein
VARPGGSGGGESHDEAAIAGREVEPPTVRRAPREGWPAQGRTSLKSTGL